MLTFDHVQQRDGRWVIVDLVGKHERVRTVPIPAWCKVAIDVWAEGMQLHSGRVFRPLNRAGRVSGAGVDGGSHLSDRQKLRRANERDDLAS